MKYLITGGAGFLGSALTKQLLEAGHQVLVYSRDEHKHYKLRQAMGAWPLLRCMVGDACELLTFCRALVDFKPHYVVLAHALKQIEICEQNPQECIRINVYGMIRAIDCIHSARDVRAAVFISSDKAVNPATIYGTSKKLVEDYIANLTSPTRFTAVRYGNVINSTGSVIPLFQRLAKAGLPITLCGLKMTRFLISVEEALALIHCALDGEVRSGSIVLPRFLYSAEIEHLAEIYSEKYGVPIHVTALRSQEKLHEELYSDYESCHFNLPAGCAVFHRQNNFELYKGDRVSRDALLSKQALRAKLDSLGLL